MNERTETPAQGASKRKPGKRARRTRDQVAADPRHNAPLPEQRRPEPVSVAPEGGTDHPASATSAAAKVSAAGGSDDLMSQPQTVPPGSPDRVAWPQRIAAAANNWKRMNDAELAATEGDEYKLTRLVERRYAIPRIDAAQQVRDFLTRTTA